MALFGAGVLTLGFKIDDFIGAAVAGPWAVREAVEKRSEGAHRCRSLEGMPRRRLTIRISIEKDLGKEVKTLKSMDRSEP
jgi:hypothetical protein